LSAIAQREKGELALDAAPRDLARLRRPDRSIRYLLVSFDVVALLGAFLIMDAAYGHNPPSETARMFLSFSPIAIAWVLAAALCGHYSRRPHRPISNELLSIFNLVTGGTWLGFIASGLLALDWSIPAVAVFWAAACALVAAGRVTTRTVVRHSSVHAENVAIVGAGTVGQLLGRKLRHHPEFGLRLIGFVDASPRMMRPDLDDVPVLGAPDEIVAIVTRYDVQRVILSFSNDGHELQLELIRALQDLDVRIDLVPRLFEAIGPTVGMYAIEGLPLVGLPNATRRPHAFLAKRVIDIMVAAIAILLLSPLFLWIALRIKAGSRGPVFFRQLRFGENRRPFVMLKFRTMVDGVDDAPHREYVRQIMDASASPNGNNLYKLERPEAVTRIGTWLRRTSLDELPQLLNVLRGEMSLVGPRPCIPYEVELFEPRHFDRFSVPAGMTGLWQLTARGHSTLKEALDLDAIYARNWSLRLDLQLLARTFLVFFHPGTTS
jgi:exopolysaccharide biosynthesis polyprenyl glycosylphosphotransferase